MEPMLSVMQKYGIPFKNPLIEGASVKGAIIGETETETGRVLHIFNGIFVRMVDSQTDEYTDDQHLFETYVNTCNFEHVKAGLEYIETMTTAAVDDEKRRNCDIVKLIAYLKA
jgi:hypothetical protein